MNASPLWYDSLIPSEHHGASGTYNVLESPGLDRFRPIPGAQAYNPAVPYSSTDTGEGDIFVRIRHDGLDGH